MTGEVNHPDEAVSRLENALERIARLTSDTGVLAAEKTDKTGEAELQLLEVAKQLDFLINRLRTSLAS